MKYHNVRLIVQQSKDLVRDEPGADKYRLTPPKGVPFEWKALEALMKTEGFTVESYERADGTGPLIITFS